MDMVSCFTMMNVSISVFQNFDERLLRRIEFLGEYREFVPMITRHKSIWQTVKESLVIALVCPSIGMWSVVCLYMSQRLIISEILYEV